MALVTVQRSPCGTNMSPNCHTQTTDEIDGSSDKKGDEKTEEKKGISECYFAVKGAALVLPHDECLHVHRKTIANGASDIQQHLQAMLYLLHADDILKMAVKLESIHSGRTRYLVVVSHTGKSQMEESCLLGIDCNNQTTIGLVLPVWADTRITLDGDGGFSITSSGRHHIFKPVSVQAMWSALQTLHKASSKAREYNYFKCGGTHQWVDYYEKRITSDRSCLNEWHAMDDIESRRPPSPDTVRLQPTEREETERHIRTKLKELMMSVDLDEVTSKYIRTRLEEILDMNLKEYKSFIDQEMLTILGQMDAPTEIFQYLYLGSEWNASNLEELVVNGIGHILNVTREIDNFFPGMFDYQNVRVYDDESTEILHYWDKTYRYIRRAKDEGSKVLVHCKMGISRSASVVIAYVMKAYDWDLQQALDFVKTKRGCIKPNSGFLKQLEIYQGILDASKQRHNSLWRSKSETNLKSDKPRKKKEQKEEKMPEKSESLHHLRVCNSSSRPKSWSPNDAIADVLFPPQNSLSTDVFDAQKKTSLSDSLNGKQLNENMNTSFVSNDSYKTKKNYENCRSIENLNIEVPLPRVSSIKDRINELESQATSTNNDKVTKVEVKSPTSQSRSGLVLNLANQFETQSKPSSPVDEGLVMKPLEEEIVEPVVSQTKPPAYKHHAILIKPSLWPEENLASSNSSSIIEKPLLNTKLNTGSEIKSCKSSSEISCSSKNFADEISPLNLVLPKVTTADEALNFYKTSQSAFKPISTSQNPNVPTSLDEKTSHYQTSLSTNNIRHTYVNNRKNAEKLPFVNNERSTHNLNSNLKDFNKLIDRLPLSKSQFKTTEAPTSTTKPPLKQISNMTSFSHFFDNNVPSNTNYFYDKEDIPFTPGTVRRTKQKIEEKNLTRATSFDSGFPFRTCSVPSTPPDSEPFSGKLIRRSHSLRNDCRPTAPFCGKWYPLPALASTLPQTFKTLQDEQIHLSHHSDSSMTHSISTPSVVEAVNRVICGTQEVLNSAIHFMPSEKKVSSTHTSSDSDFDFGSASSLPDIDNRDLLFGKSPPTQSESPVPGLVKQQREILESKATKTINEKSNDQSKIKRDAPKLMPSDLGSNLVACDMPKQEENKESGIVKRLKKELEAKSSSDNCKKEKLIEDDMLKCTEKNFTTSLPILDKQTCRLDSELEPNVLTRHHSSLSSSLESKSTFDEQKAPPTPHRKTSLDLSFLHKRFPLNIKLGTQTTSVPILKPNLRTTYPTDCKKCEISEGCKISSGRPPPIAKTNPIGLTEIPPPPPLGLQRKLRKQQGSTHPLSKLSRHVSPLYNTM